MIEIKKFKEMPHFKVEQDYYDLKLEDHVKDSFQEFLQYLLDFIDEDQGVALEIAGNKEVKQFVKKYIGNWEEIERTLLSI